MTDAFGRDLGQVAAAQEWARALSASELRAAIAEWTRRLESEALIGDDALRYEAAHAALRERVS
ncbi:MAG: hypothetical protein M5U32_11555 [Myxococcota bacterium]|nr:hypothetical protein [Myxococcota bacterium]